MGEKFPYSRGTVLSFGRTVPLFWGTMFGQVRFESITVDSKPRGASLHKHRTGTARRIAELFRRHLTNSQMHFAMAEILAYLAYHEVM